MKNIERPEVLLPIFKFLTEPSYGIAMLLHDLYKLGMPDDIYKRRDWLYSEYVEPHHWEPWELEFLKHTNKKYLWVAISGNGYVWLYTDKPHKSVSTENYIGQSYTDTQTKFDTLKQGEIIPIDEELERNGMHR